MTTKKTNENDGFQWVPANIIDGIISNKRGRRRTSKYAAMAERLRANPGKWALINPSTNATGLASMIRRGKHAQFRPAGAFEVVTDRNDDGTTRVFCRYIGEEK